MKTRGHKGNKVTRPKGPPPLGEIATAKPGFALWVFGAPTVEAYGFLAKPKHYRMKAEAGRLGVNGAVRRRNVPMTTGWRWYALQIEPGSEFVAQRRLKVEGFEDTFLPLLHAPHAGKGHRFLRASPRLPGYLFIGFSSNAVPWPEVLTVKGVISVVAFDDKPTPFTAHEMHALVLAAQRPRRVLGGAAKVRTKNKKADGSSQIMSGPYAGSVVRVIDTDEGEALYAFDTRKYRLNAEQATYSVNGRRRREP